MLKTFPKGGIHPPENKLTSSKPIKKLPLPKAVYVPISQHIGIPAEIVVDRKDKRGVDPQTGEAIQIPEKKIPRFSAGKAFKESVG